MSEEEDFGDYIEDEDEEEMDEGMFGGGIEEPQMGDKTKSTIGSYLYEVVGDRQIKAQMGGQVINLKRKFDYAPFPESFFLKALREAKFMTDRAMRKLEDTIFDKLEDKKYHEVVLDKKKSYECNILCEEFEFSKIRHFGCGHTFEEECMTEYIMEEIKRKGPLSIDSLCPYDGCGFMITQSIVDDNCDGVKKALFQKFCMDNFTQLSPYVVPCLNSNCPKYFLASESSVLPSDCLPQLYAICDCGCNACLGCQSKGHEPLKCEMYKQWEESIGQILDSLNENWKKSNSKKCPGCKVDIQKNEGCMHMTCAKCRHEFCWLCMGDWKKHGSNTGGYFKCNIFVEEEHSDQEKADIAKLQFYTDRYFQHRNSLEASEKKFQKIAPKYTDYEDKTNLVPKVNDELYPGMLNFYRDGFRTILKCRSFVTFTYPLAYFIKNESELKLFLENQYMLEFSLEKLDKFFQKNELESFIQVKANQVYLSKDYEKNRSSVIGMISQLEGQFTNAVKEFKDPVFLEKIAVSQKLQKDKNLAKFFKNNTMSESEKKGNKKSNNWQCTGCTYYNENNLTTRCTMCSSNGRPRNL